MVQWHQGLPPHGVGAAAEQHLDLVVVELGRALAQPTVALEVEVLQVIAGIALFGLFLPPHLVVLALMPPPLHPGQVAKVGLGAEQRIDGVTAQVVRRPVIASLDVGHVALHQPAQVFQDGRRLRRRALDRSFWLNRFGQAGGEPILTEVEADAGCLRQGVAAA